MAIDKTSADTEKVIDILVKAKRSPDRFLGPVHDVDKAMHWDSKKTRGLVEDLEKRGLIVARTTAINSGSVPPEVQIWWWERP